MSTTRKRVYGYLAEFPSASALYKAAEKVRDAGFRKWDCHTPYPVHGLDGAMGLKRSNHMPMFTAIATPMTTQRFSRQALNQKSCGESTLQDIITMKHIDNLAKIILLTGTIVGYAYLMELFVAFYSGSIYEMAAFKFRIAGPYWWAYAAMVPSTDSRASMVAR